MKKCPYCDEKIKDAAIKCRYCGNFLDSRGRFNMEVLPRAESIVYWSIFVIVLLFYDLLMVLVWLSMNESYSLYFTIFFFIWDVFFGYFLLRSSKKWPKMFIAIRIVIRLVAMIRPVLSTPSLHPISEISTLLSFLFLLFMINRRIFKKIKIGFVSLAYGIFIFATGSLFFQNMQYKITIQNLPFLNEYTSDKGYRIKLPSVKWRILKEEQALKYLGDFAKNCDITLTADNGKLHGFLLSIPINKDDFNIVDIKETMKKEMMPDGIKNLKEKQTDSEITMKFVFLENNEQYASIYNFKAFNRMGLFSLFVSSEGNFNKYDTDIETIISSIAELPLKVVLKKISPSDLFVKYNDAVALIRVYNKQGEIYGFGTCFNLMKDGLIVTNLHIIMGANYFDVKFPSGAVYEEGYLVGLSKKIEDLVLLKIIGDNIPYLETETASELAIGDRIFVIGNPEGLVNSLSEGIVSGIREVSANRKYYQITAPISPGSSGSPVFDEFGRLVGIATFYLEGGQNLNFCIPIDELASLEVFKNMITLEQFSQILKENE